MAESELIPTLRRFGLDYVVYNPVAGGESWIDVVGRCHEWIVYTDAERILWYRNFEWEDQIRRGPYRGKVLGSSKQRCHVQVRKLPIVVVSR